MRNFQRVFINNDTEYYMFLTLFYILLEAMGIAFSTHICMPFFLFGRNYFCFAAVCFWLYLVDMFGSSGHKQYEGTQMINNFLICRNCCSCFFPFSIQHQSRVSFVHSQRTNLQILRQMKHYAPSAREPHQFHLQLSLVSIGIHIYMLSFM